MIDTNVAIGLFGGLALFITTALLVIKYFIPEFTAFIKSLDKPSEKEIKQQSDALLTQMDHNIAERKEELINAIHKLTET